MSNASISKSGIDEPFSLQVARGQIYKHAHLDKFGFNADIGTTQETLWSLGGVYTWRTAATKVKISSSDAKDTAAGVGARTVTIQGLDANFAETEETITMAGQTASAESTNTYLRIHRAFVVTNGSEIDNAGTLYVHETGAALTSGVPDDATKNLTVISPGYGQTLQSFYTVPASKTLYITQLHAAVGGAALNTVTTTLRTKDATLAANLFAWNTKAIRVFGLGGVADGQLSVPIKVTEKYDIEMTAVVNTSTASVTGTFAGYLIDA